MPHRKSKALHKVKEGVQELLDIIKCLEADKLTLQRVQHGLEDRLQESLDRAEEMRRTIVALRASLRGSIKDE